MTMVWYFLMSENKNNINLVCRILLCIANDLCTSYEHTLKDKYLIQTMPLLHGLLRDHVYVTCSLLND